MGDNALADRFCCKCGESLKRSMLTALLIDFGATSSVNPCECPKGGDHEFIERERAASAATLEAEAGGEDE